MVLQYPVDLSVDDNGRVAVLFGGLPGKAWGLDETDASARAADAVIIVLAGCVSAGEKVPAPPPARGRATVSVPAWRPRKWHCTTQSSTPAYWTLTWRESSKYRDT